MNQYNDIPMIKILDLSKYSTFRLVATHSKYYKAHGLKCYKCQKPLNGQKIVSKGGNGSIKYYCIPCAKQLYFIK